MTTREILTAARALIDTPEKWTQGANARDINNQATPADSAEAVCWCASGALRAASGIQSDVPARRRMFQVLGAALVLWNDDVERTHAAVLAAFDRAIVACPNEVAA